MYFQRKKRLAVATRRVETATTLREPSMFIHVADNNEMTDHAHIVS